MIHDQRTMALKNVIDLFSSLVAMFTDTHSRRHNIVMNKEQGMIAVAGCNDRIK